jgi:hypothetical protein
MQEKLAHIIFLIITFCVSYYISTNYKLFQTTISNKLRIKFIHFFKIIIKLKLINYILVILKYIINPYKLAFLNNKYKIIRDALDIDTKHSGIFIYKILLIMETEAILNENSSSILYNNDYTISLSEDIKSFLNLTKDKRKKKLLVIDLDETLVHSSIGNHTFIYLSIKLYLSINID